MAIDSSELIHVGQPPKLGAYLRELWSRREYAVTVPLGNLRAAHMNTLLGNVWHVLNPLMLIGVYWLVFGVILERVREGVDNYIAFLAVGVFIFRFTQNSVQQGAGSIIINSALIRSIYFPRAILPIATVVEQILLLAPSVVVMIVIALATGEVPRWSWLLLPAVLALQTLFNLGAAFIAPRITDTFRDFQNVLPYFFRILFYLPGILFSVEHFLADRPTALAISNLNPAYAFITVARHVLLGTNLPEAVLRSAIGWAAVMLVAGFLFFRAAEPRYGRG